MEDWNMKRFAYRTLLVASTGLLFSCGTGAITAQEPDVASANSASASKSPEATLIHRFPLDPEVQLLLARRYASGDGVDKDPVLACHWAGMAAYGGHGPALQWLQERAQSGDAFAHVELALVYAAARDQGSKDKAASERDAAVKLLEPRAATDPVAAFGLGVVLVATKDEATRTRGLELLKSAADAGHVRA